MCAGQLQRVCGLQQSVRLVRVYSETVESEEFAVPGHVTRYKSRARLAAAAAESDRSLRSISLHHLIRAGDGADAQLIRTTDLRLTGAEDEEAVTSDDLLLYRRTIKERERELLTSADVILCTCVTAGAARITSATNITQVRLSLCLTGSHF